MMNRVRAALRRAEEHWLADLAGVCLLFLIPHAVLLAGLIWEGAR